MIAAVVLITLHAVGGVPVQVNPHLVTSLHHPRQPDHSNKLVVDDVRCVVMLADGKFVSVIEPCEEVQTKVEQAR